MRVKTRSSGRLMRTINQAKRARGVNQVDVGFFDTAKYKDGTPVTNVAAKNEFGLGNVPSRPFFRNSNFQTKVSVPKFLRERIDTATMVVTPQLARQVGILASNDLKRSITELRKPPNTEYTKKRKKSSNPLIDTGFMRKSASYKIIK